MFVDNVRFEVNFFHDGTDYSGSIIKYIRFFPELQSNDEVDKDLTEFYRDFCSLYDYVYFIIDFKYKNHYINYEFYDYSCNVVLFKTILNETLYEFKSNKCKWLNVCTVMIDGFVYKDMDLYEKLAEIYNS